MPSGLAMLRRDPRFLAVMVGLAIVAFAIVPWFVPLSHLQAHNVLHHLNFIPLMLAGMLLGWRGALAGTAFAWIAHFPHILHTWHVARFDAGDQIVELSIFGAAGVIAGFLSDRERAQRAKAEKTSRELAKVYQELQQNVEQLKKAERLYAAGQLSASLAHEIRNPLISISGAAGILQRGNASKQNVQECLEIIDKESHRLNKLLTSFLDFARPRAPRFQWTDLTTVIQSVTSLAIHASGVEHVELRQSLNGNIPEVQCDPEQVKQVLLNLIINAVQASPPGGVVWISAEADSSRVSISVRDQGSGVAEEHQNHIFDPFFTTKEQGSGLGLAIASMIISQHGGALTATKNPDRGMTFRIELARNPRADL
jgi:two-component system, NtrC family, sensor histidine kinase HydH